MAVEKVVVHCFRNDICNSRMQELDEGVVLRCAGLKYVVKILVHAGATENREACNSLIYYGTDEGV